MRSSVRQARRVYDQEGFATLVGKAVSHGADVVGTNLTAPLAEAILRRKAGSLADPQYVDSREYITKHGFGTRERVTFDEPTRVQSLPPYLERYVGRTESVPAPFVCEVDDVHVVGAPADGRNAHAVYLTPDRDVLVYGEGGFDTNGELYTHWVRKHLTEVVKSRGIGALRIGSGSERDGPHYDVACPLMGLSCLTYGHWILNYLPKVRELKRYADETGASPTLLVHPERPEWQTASLTALGFDESQIVPWEHDHATVGTLVVPGPRFVHIQPDGHERLYRSQQEQACPVFAPSAFRWLRETLRESLDVDTTRERTRLYASRHDVKDTTDFKNKRMVRNEGAVVDLLDEYGVERYFPAQLSFEQQFRRFSDAEMVVGPCGSALDNVIFTDESTVVELFGGHSAPDMVGPYQYAAASALDLDYVFLVGESVEDDIRIDPERLRQLLDTLDP